MNEHESKVDTIVFDVDGTLYDTEKLKKYVNFRFIRHYLLNPKSSGEAKAVKEYIKCRELPKYKEMPTRELCDELARLMNLHAERTYNAVVYWTEKAPLRYMKKFARYNVIDFLVKMHKQGHCIVIYSDTPAVEKLAALGISDYDFLYAPSTGEGNWIKPSLSKMKEIRRDLDLDASDRICLVGDKIDEDGESATFLDAAFIFVFDSKTYIGSYYESLCTKHYLFA